MKKVWKAVLAVVLLLVLMVVGYVLYVVLSYHRIEDLKDLAPAGTPAEEAVKVGEEYSIATYNLGFGAYNRDFSFFMDGGKYGTAVSEEVVREDIAGALGEIQALAPDFCLFQEVDINSTRSYHVDQLALLEQGLGDMARVSAVNYDSAFLFYPLYQPHGKSLACQATFSRFPIETALRVSLPIEEGFMKFLDLDRCFSIARVPVENGKTLSLVNLHLTAYSSDGSIVREQLEKLNRFLREEYQEGNYVICGGDFNQDLPGDSVEALNGNSAEFTWAQPFPEDALPENFLLCRETGEGTTATCRNADRPYDPEDAFLVVVDGFLVSDNVEALSLTHVDTQFQWSDHNPVELKFRLKD